MRSPTRAAAFVGAILACALAGAPSAFGEEGDESTPEAVDEVPARSATARSLATVRVAREVLDEAALTALGAEDEEDGAALTLTTAGWREGLPSAPSVEWASEPLEDALVAGELTLASPDAYRLAVALRPDLRYLRSLTIRVTPTSGRAAVRVEARFATYTAASVLAFEARFLIARPAWLLRGLGAWGERLHDLSVRADRDRVVIEATLAPEDVRALTSMGVAAWSRLPVYDGEDDPTEQEQD